MHDILNLAYYCFVTTENFVKQLIGGLSYPDEMIKSECAYVLTQLCTENKPLPLTTVKKLCNSIMSMSAITKSHNSTVNLLGQYLITHMHTCVVSCLDL